MDTLLLDPNTWDLVLDSKGNIALASSKYPNDPAQAQAYAQAQDAASQIRLFEGELIYDVNQGIPYWQEILGYMPPTQLIMARFEEAALLVPGVTQAIVNITSVKGRTVTGTVYITNEAGASAQATFTT